MQINGSALWREAHHLNDLALQKGTFDGFRTEARVSDQVTLTSDPLPSPSLHPQGTKNVVTFMGLQKGDNENIQVLADYEFLADGNLRREVHEQSSCGNVVMDTVVAPNGKVLSHQVTDGLTEESKAILREWNLSH